MGGIECGAPPYCRRCNVMIYEALCRRIESLFQNQNNANEETKKGNWMEKVIEGERKVNAGERNRV